MKKRLFIAIQYLEIGGAERSLIGLLNAIDYTRYEVDLFVYRHTGEFMSLIPKEVNLLPEIKKYTTISRPIKDIIKEGGDTRELEWYMKDPTKVEDDNPNESHEIINLPSYISIKPIEENIENNIIQEIDNIEKQEQITDISNKKFKISINKKTWIITGGALVGILSGLGIAIKVSNKNRNKYRKQLQNTARPRYNNYPTPSRYYYYNSQNNYDYNQKHHRR